MDRTFSVFGYRLDGTASNLIWFTNEVDGVVTDERGRILDFRDLSELRGYAAHHGLVLYADEPEPSPIDLDEIGRWLEAPTNIGIDCTVYLNSWNLFDDVARSVQDVEFGQLSKASCIVYDKLFWGSNLPAVTPPGEHYDPVWSEEDVEMLRQVLMSGMALFRRSRSG